MTLSRLPLCAARLSVQTCRFALPLTKCTHTLCICDLNPPRVVPHEVHWRQDCTFCLVQLLQCRFYIVCTFLDVDAGKLSTVLAPTWRVSRLTVLGLHRKEFGSYQECLETKVAACPVDLACAHTVRCSCFWNPLLTFISQRAPSAVPENLSLLCVTVIGADGKLMRLRSHLESATGAKQDAMGVDGSILRVHKNGSCEITQRLFSETFDQEKSCVIE